MSPGGWARRRPQRHGPGTYVYDGNGNPTTFGGTSLSFDVENRMTGYGTALTAGYRGDGLRAWKQPGGGNKTYFLYDGISVLCELDNTGAVSASSTYGANGLLSRGSTQYQFDPLGDAVLLLDGSGDVTATQGFDAWGNALVTATGPFGYRARYGYFADSETGLVALAYRYYAPGVGRFLNRDPIRYYGGVNAYDYTANRPIALTDASGHKPCEECREDRNNCLVDAGFVLTFALVVEIILCGAVTVPAETLTPAGHVAAFAACMGWACGADALSAVAAAVGCYIRYTNCTYDCT